VIVVHGGYANFAGDHDVGVAFGVADLVDALARGELLDFYLAGEDGEFVVVEEGEEWDGAKRFWTAAHGGTSGVWEMLGRIPQIGDGGKGFATSGFL
jgi:hypothetical protein